MKQGQFSSEQIIGILQEGERGERPISQVCRQHGTTETTVYR